MYSLQWSRMELNHRFLDVSQASLPLDHGTDAKFRGTGTFFGYCARSQMAPQLPTNEPVPVSVSCGGWNRTNIATFKASHPAVRRPRSARVCLLRHVSRSRVR